MQDTHPNIVVLVMAAGDATRMGKIKQLLPWKDTTLLNHAIAQAKEVSKEIVVVLGAHSEAIKKTLPNGVAATVNHHWKRGLGNSIAHGVGFVREHYQADGILIMLADQPLLDSTHLNRLLATFRSENMTVATQYEHGVGVPTVFHPSMLNRLQQLDADKGAGKILNEKTTKLKKIAPPTQTIDIDTVEDYQRMHQQYGK